PLWVEDAPRAFDVVVSARREALALDEAAGHATLDGSRRVALGGASVLTLASGTRVRLAPQGDGVRAQVDGRAFQLVAGGEARIPSALLLQVEARVAASAGGYASPEFRLVASDPDADPVITAVRIEGAPDGAVRLPGYVSLTEQVARDMGGDPVARAMLAPAMPALLFADAFGAFVDALFGPAPLTQQIEGGSTFSSRLAVSGEGAPYEATIVVEGNFPTTRATFRVA
ncbi:MAG TPA: hypothetical protein VHH36_02810, partial [Candidatus Thermoplasmatota archaeon]|nr:hypothetical protein [Candidatus Thermoplasmatota archaeon]